MSAQELRSAVLDALYDAGTLTTTEGITVEGLADRIVLLATAGLQDAVKRFIRERGVHGGDHYQKTPDHPDGMSYYCAQCDEAYIRAEAALDEARGRG